MLSQYDFDTPLPNNQDTDFYSPSQSEAATGT